MPDAVSRQMRTADGGAILRTFGPMPDGSFLQALHFFIASGPQQLVTINVALSSQRNIDAAAFATAERLIDFGDNLTNEHPDIPLRLLANSVANFFLPVNRRIVNGPRWLHVSLSGGGEGPCDLVISATFLTLDEVTAQFGTPRPVTIIGPAPPLPTVAKAAPT